MLYLTSYMFSLFFLFTKSSDLLWLAPSVFLVGILFDNISTYVLARIHGLEEFYEREANGVVVKLVKKYGLEKGLMYSLFHPTIVLAEVVVIILFASFTFYISFHEGTFYNPVIYVCVGVLALGWIKSEAAIHNTVLCFNHEA